ncbi:MULTISPECIES: FtsX-like permease family protein [Clostridium]|uniref:ABC transporter permease protein YxdM n=1 Tax=Clostridium ragsdalei P11 TaxID=1353534 RepID=A0A1A6AHU9_9CLOT|nr:MULTISPECIES: ABC transporter permease [Clostridium]OBR89652.1 ABC transporter permease protein YxdM [Clostridium ragsdalei P11]QXE21082.1 ABC transporter permease [Clostridium sp. 001]
MTFISLAVNNVKKNFNNYVMYLISAVFSVMIFYIFSSIAFNEVIMKLADNKPIVKAIFKASAGIVALFSFVFIWYSNSFFLKTRKKEIAIYSMVGMEKKQIAKMLFYENLIIGVLAILCGIVLGTMFSKYFSLMLIYLMKETLNIKFIISLKAFEITIVVFCILFLLNSFHSYSIIYRYKLIELLSAQKEGEKQPNTSLITSILSLVFIAAGYIMTYDKTTMQLVKIGIPIVILVSIGTYFLFSSFIIIFIRTIKRNRSVYYRGENMISVSQILYRIKSNAKTLSVIALLSAVTLTSVAASYSFYKTTEKDMGKDMVFSYEFVNADSSLNKKIEDTINKYDNKLISRNNLKLISAKVNLPILNKDDFEGKIISQSDYNSVITIKNRGNKVNLKGNECLFIQTSKGSSKKYTYLRNPVLVKLENSIMNFTIIKSTDVQVVSPAVAASTIVVSDKAFKGISSQNKITNMNGYIVQNPEKSKELTKKLNEEVSKDIYVDSYYDSYQGFYKGGAVLIFIGMFLGILFFLATGSIISFKQLMEASDDERRYSTLRKIGMNRQEIKKSIAKQLSVTFGMPLVVAICHSTAALIVFQRLMNEGIMNYCVIIMLGYILMYFLYYIVTVNSYTNIVCKKE